MCCSFIPGMPPLLHPINCFQETFENFLPSPPFSSDSHCFCGAMAAVKITRLQDLGGAMSKRLQWISASRKNTCLHRNHPLISCEPLSTSKKLLHLLPNSRLNLCSLLPKKKGGNKHQPFISHHSIGSHLTPASPHQRSHTSHWIQSPSSWPRWASAKAWCSWRRSIVMTLCRSVITWKRKYAQILTSHGRSCYLCSLDKSKLYDSIWRIFPLILFR